MLKKRGQYFLLGAVILAFFLFTIALTINQVITQDKERKLLSHAEEIEREISYVLDHQVYNPDSEDELEKFIDLLSSDLKEKEENFNFIAIYGNSSEVKIKNFGISTITIQGFQKEITTEEIIDEIEKETQLNEDEKENITRIVEIINEIKDDYTDIEDLRAPTINKAKEENISPSLVNKVINVLKEKGFELEDSLEIIELKGSGAHIESNIRIGVANLKVKQLSTQEESEVVLKEVEKLHINFDKHIYKIEMFHDTNQAVFIIQKDIEHETFIEIR